MENVAKLEQTNFLQNFSLMCRTLSWDVTMEDSIWWTRSAIAGITDFLNMVKKQSQPKAVLIQDIKGNKIIFACVQYVPAEDDSEAATGSWTYFWSWNMEDLPENTDVYTIDQQQVQEVIVLRGHDLCNMSFTTARCVSQLSVFMFSILHDMLDQQAVEEGKTWTVELDGYFEASVTVENGQKVFTFAPKGEMKMLIKDDTVSEV